MERTGPRALLTDAILLDGADLEAKPCGHCPGHKPGRTGANHCQIALDLSHDFSSTSQTTASTSP